MRTQAMLKTFSLAAVLTTTTVGCITRPSQDVAPVPPAPLGGAPGISQGPVGGGAMYADPYAQPTQPGQPAAPLANDPFAVPPASQQPMPGDPYAPAAGAAGRQSYVVQKGDTLWSIANRVYGNGQRWKDIQSANPGLDPTRMRAGQTILLP